MSAASCSYQMGGSRNPCASGAMAWGGRPYVCRRWSAICDVATIIIWCKGRQVVEVQRIAAGATAAIRSWSPTAIAASGPAEATVSSMCSSNSQQVDVSSCGNSWSSSSCARQLVQQEQAATGQRPAPGCSRSRCSWQLVKCQESRAGCQGRCCTRFLGKCQVQACVAGQGICTVWLLAQDRMASADLICIQHRHVACLEHVRNSGLAHPNGPCARHCRASASGASAADALQAGAAAAAVGWSVPCSCKQCACL